MKIAVYTVALNEEQFVKRWYESAQDADYLLIADTGSTDKTKEICSAYPVKFIENKWLGYSQTKNLGNNLAKFNYIFSIDADEALSKDLQEEILSLKKKQYR